MEDQTPSSSDPAYQSTREKMAARRTPPHKPAPAQDSQEASAIPLVNDPSQVPVESEMSAISPADPPHDDLLVEPNAGVAEAYPIAAETAAPPLDATGEPPRDALPGDAAPVATGTVMIIRPPAPQPPAVKKSPEKPAPKRPAPIQPTSNVETALMPSRGGTFSVLAILWLAVWMGAMTLVLNHPFDRKFDWDTSYFSIAARNLVRDGFWTIKGGMYLTAGEGFGMQREFYAGHPPMTAWLLAGWMKLLGTSDAAIRSLPLACTGISLLMLFLLIARVFGAGTGLAAMVFCSLMPMTAFYAQNVNMEPVVLALVLIAANGYLSWCKSGSRFGLMVLVLCVILGCWTDWPMYLFAGFLAILHFFHRPVPLPSAKVIVAPAVTAKDSSAPAVAPEPPPVAPEKRGIVFSLAMLVIPLAIFAVFLGYLKFLHGAKPTDLIESATSRIAAKAPGAGQESWTAGYQLLFGRFHLGNKAMRGEFKTWFLDLFTPSALVLAALGLLLLPAWSRRLAGGDERSRRAAVRVLACILLMQLAYTLLFPQGAWKHEFWQYYLIVPVAVLAGGLCVWLTMAGRPHRGFFTGLVDRGAWAVAALIPLWAVGPLTWRLHIDLPGRVETYHSGDALHLSMVKPLRESTSPSDVILTDMNEEQTQFALPWYADRKILPDGMENYSTTTEKGLAELIRRFENRRILYWWTGNGPKEFEQYLDRLYPNRLQMRFVVAAQPVSVSMYVIRGQGGQQPTGGSAESAAVLPASRPATRPATSPGTKR